MQLANILRKVPVLPTPSREKVKEEQPQSWLGRLWQVVPKRHFDDLTYAEWRRIEFKGERHQPTKTYNIQRWGL